MAQHKLRRVLLRKPLQFRIRGRQRRLSAQNFPDPAAKRRPVSFGHRKMPPEVEQRHLANALAQALRAHQPVRRVGLARALVMGANPPDIHAGASIGQPRAPASESENVLKIG